MNSTQTKTLLRIYERPMRTDLRWKEVEKLLTSLGVELTDGKGSHMRALMRDDEGNVIARMNIMRPHNPPYFHKYAMADLKRFLETIGVGPESESEGDN